MDRQAEPRRTELQDPRVDATGGGSKRDDNGVREQRAHQRERTQDGRELDPADPVHDGDERVSHGSGTDTKDGTGQQGRGEPEKMTKEALEAREAADRD